MNLDHSGVQALLDEYIDGGLAAEECGEVERHLESCVECAAEVESLLALRARTRDLPREIAPGRDLWPEIQARLQAAPARQVAAPERLVGAEVGVIDLAARRGRATRWSGGVLGRAAAVIALIVLSSGATAYLLRGRGTAPVAVAPAAPQSQATGNVRLAADRDISTFRAGSGGFEGAVEGLRTTFESHRDRLSPETVKIVEQNLAIIDRAIAESRAALEKDPNDPDLPLLLSGVYRQKLELLQQAVQLQARS